MIPFILIGLGLFAAYQAKKKETIQEQVQTGDNHTLGINNFQIDPTELEVLHSFFETEETSGIPESGGSGMFEPMPWDINAMNKTRVGEMNDFDVATNEEFARLQGWSQKQ